MPLLMSTFCSILSKTKNNVKYTLFASIPVRIWQNNQIFVKDCFVIRRIEKISYRDVPDKMAARVNSARNTIQGVPKKPPKPLKSSIVRI